MSQNNKTIGGNRVKLKLKSLGCSENFDLKVSRSITELWFWGHIHGLIRWLKIKWLDVKYVCFELFDFIYLIHYQMVFRLIHCMCIKVIKRFLKALSKNNSQSRFVHHLQDLMRLYLIHSFGISKSLSMHKGMYIYGTSKKWKLIKLIVAIID